MLSILDGIEVLIVNSRQLKSYLHDRFWVAALNNKSWLFSKRKLLQRRHDSGSRWTCF